MGDEIAHTAGTLAYISGRISSTQYTVTDRFGAPSADVPSASVNRIYRAFASLSAAEAGSDDGGYLNTADLSGGNFQLNWPCYNDGALTDSVTVSGYTTGPTNYIRIFTPVSSSEVGASQRHRGVFGTGFQVGSTNNFTIRILDAYVRIEGLTIQLTSTAAGSGREGILSQPAGVSDVRISHNIIKGVISGNNNADPTGILVGANDANVHRISNNIVYGFHDNLQDQFGIQHNDGDAYIFSNTVFNCATGFVRSSPSLNNLNGMRSNVSINFALNAAYKDYSFTDGVNSYNVSSDATATTYACTGCQINKTAYASYFTSTLPGDEDFHLRTTSFNLWGSNGANLFVNPNLAVTDDIDGAARVRPDIGADEFGPAPGPQMLVLSGTYVGNGALSGRSIYVGFQPDLVIVSSDSTNAGVGASYPTGHTAVLRSSSMSGNLSMAAYVYAHTPLANRITSLDPTGFTVGHPPDHAVPNDEPTDPYHCVNHTGVGYYWTAFKAAPGQMVAGSYTGSGGVTQDVTTVGFSPDYVIVMPSSGESPVQRFAAMPVDYSFDFDGGSQCPAGCPRSPGIRTELANGFRVGTYVNTNTVLYHYVAWNQTPGRIAVGSYPGDGSNDRSITGTGFRPEFVTISNGQTPVPNTSTTFKSASTGVSTDYSLVYVAYTSAYQGPDAIQKLEVDGFQIGQSNNVNSAGEPHYWAAFGPHGAGVNLRSIGPAANYGTGTVQATTGSMQVLGAGTAWRTANRGRGDRMFILGSSLGDYTVASVVSDTELYLTVPYEGTNGPGHSYFLQRKFAQASQWVDCVNGPLQAACGTLEAGATLVSSTSLVTDDRREVGILYNDDGPDGDSLPEPFLPPAGNQPIVWFAGMTTDAAHTVTLTVDPGNRHAGVGWNGVGATPHVAFDYAGGTDSPIRVEVDFVTLEWIDLRAGNQNGISLSGAITASNGSVQSTIVLRDNIVHAVGMAFDIAGTSLVVDIYNNVVYNCNRATRNEAVQSSDPSLVRIFNNTAWGCTDGFHVGPSANGRVLLRNNLVAGTTGNDFWLLGTISALSSHNLSEDGTAAVGGASPGGGGQPNIPLGGGSGINFFSTTPGSENLHLQGTSWAIDRATNLGAVFGGDIDGATRTGAWDIGADEFGATTAVKLQSFVAVAGDRSVVLEWRTASELANLGFHVYRGLSASGPWTRLTPSLIPGLGSSAIGQAYAFRDAGLVNGTRYFYRLEDVDASSKTTSHGPVSAVPSADAEGGTGADAGRDKKKGSASSTCPDWVLAAYGSSVSSDATSASLRCTRHGDPEAVSLGVVSRDSRQATLELKTGGFYALHTLGGTGEPSGTVRVFVPGFDFPQDEKAAALPIRRALADAVVGRRVQLGGVRALDVVSFKGLVPSALGKAEMQVGRDGTVRAARRSPRAPLARFPKSELATLLPSVFQGETKSAVVQIAPLRFDAQRQQLVLAKRVLVKLLFTGREAGESGRGRFGRAAGTSKPVSGEVLARLYTTSRGLHSVSFEQLVPGRSRGFAASQLRLERQGEAVAFHVEPATDSFGPGSRLFFFADRTAGSTDFSPEVAYELVRSRDGLRMSLAAAAPAGDAIGSVSTGFASFETNRFYQPGLLEAPDLWLWEALASGATRVKSFSLGAVAAASSQAAELDVFLQGASESGQPIDHHVSVMLNGTPVGEAQFAGKRPYRMSLSVPASLLREGPNDLSLTNVADTGVTSYVFLDRFTFAHPQLSSLSGGRFDGRWSESGSVGLSAVGSVSGPVMVVDVTAGPVWLTGHEIVGGSVRFRAEAGHRYWAGSDSALFSPRVAQPLPSGLKSASNQADYLLIAPRAFLAAAEPLVARRADQGLTTRAVAFEEISDEFGHGRPSAEAIKSFLAYAFQSWARPSPRYVLLLGDSTYDPRNFIFTSQPSPLPALWAKTSYLWTVADPELAAVNGEDALPDLAIGRLPAATVEQAQMLVDKLIAWEDSRQGLSGAAALVADNPDLAGDFDANIDDIGRSFLQGRAVSTLKLSELGAQTRPAIQDALNSGLSLLSYVGHGGAAVWASENVWNSWDAPSLQAQSQQPFLLTMNCLNGYFVAPAFDSLSESLLKAEGRGAIAAFSPSGLSLDGPAHQYHRALLAELTSGRHARLGDAVLAAQKTYAQTGLMPELLSVYHLLGDPAMKIRQENQP